MIGAPGLTAASPVSMPTFSAPKVAHSAKNFSDTSALIGAVQNAAAALRPARRSSAPVATRLLPEPVGVASTTLLPETSSISASVWAGIEVQALLAGPAGEGVEQGVRVGVGGHPVGEGHVRAILPDRARPRHRSGELALLP